MSFSSCPHGIHIIRCKTCNKGPICIHGVIKDMCGTCDERKSNVCSVLKKTLEYTLSKLVPKNKK